MSLRERQAFPDAAREGRPQGDEHTIAPVDDDAAATMQNAFDDVARSLLRRNHHGVVALGNEIGAHEAWQDVSDGDVVMTLVGDLRQSFEILALHALCCAISRGDA